MLMDSTYLGHVPRRFSDFLMASSFFYSNKCSRSVLAKNWRLCTQLVANACKICFRVVLSSIVPAHFPNQISKGRQLKSQKHGRGCGLKNYNYYVKMAFYTPLVCLSLVLYPSGRQLHANCQRWAAILKNVSTKAIPIHNF